MTSSEYQGTHDSNMENSNLPLIYDGPPSYLMERLTQHGASQKLQVRWMTRRVTAMIGLVGTLIVFGGLLLREKNFHRNLEQRVTNQDRWNAAMETEKEESLHINYVSNRDFDNPPSPAPGNISVIVRNVTFASNLDWSIGGDEALHRSLPPGDSRWSLPGGAPVAFFCRPSHTQAWQQVVQASTRHKDGSVEELGMSLTKYVVKLSPGDELTIHFQEPTPPWNAIVVPFQGESMLITLERPMADYEFEKWRSGKYEGKEELPNTALFWARDGSRGLAQELAKYFVQHRDERGRIGRFRGLKHVRLIVPADQERVSLRMQNAKQNELEDALTQALELLKLRRSSSGRSVQDEIDRAKDLLKLINPA